MKHIERLFRVCILLACIAAGPATVHGSLETILKKIDKEKADPVQARYKREIAKSLHGFINKYNSYDFISRGWVSIGNLDKMTSPFWHKKFKVIIDRNTVELQKSEAFYLPKWKYVVPVRELYLITDPRYVSPFLLWHEMIHAVSHRNDQDGGVTFSYIEPVAKEKDHLYIEWAECCVSNILLLAEFEEFIKQAGPKPSKEQLTQAQQKWRVFYRSTQRSSYHENNVMVLPTYNQKDELRRMMGFHLDPHDIITGYIANGYAPEYFRAAVTLNFWTPRIILDVTNYPGESTEVTIRFSDPVGNRQYGWIDFEYETAPGIWAEIAKPEICPCAEYIKRTITPLIADPTKTRTFFIKISYLGGLEHEMLAPPITGKITVIPFKRKLTFIIEDADTGDKIKESTVILKTGQKTIGNPQKAADGKVQFDNLEPINYRAIVEAPGYETLTVESILLPAVSTRGEASNPKVLTVKMTEAGLEGLTIEPSQVHIQKLGATETLKACKLFKDGKTQPLTSGVTWESDAPHIARVDKNSGVVTAVADGAATIRTAWGSRTASIAVRVSQEVKVPDLIGKTEAEAKQLTGALSLNLVVSEASMNNPDYPPGTVVSQTPPPNTLLAKGGDVHVELNPYPFASIGIKAEPDKYSYQLEDKITFTEDVQKKNPNNQYTFKWFVDSKEAGTGKSCTHRFTTPGRHNVQLVMESSNPKENDAIIKNISVEYPPETEVEIKFNPETNIYTLGATVGFEAITRHAKGIKEYRWYVNDDYIASGEKDVTHTFTEAGTYEIKLGLRWDSNFDGMKTTRTLRVGEAGIGLLGRERNRFEAQGAPENLDILSSYWIGGDSKWSNFTRFDNGLIGAVDHFILYTGDQADGYNTGFLVYVPKGKNELLFRVFHFRWPDRLTHDRRDPHGFLHYSGRLDLHYKSLLPDSVHFTRQSARLCEIEWRTTDDSICRARICKFSKDNKIQFSGVEDLGCEYDQTGWKSKHTGPHGSISPKADQWAAGGGFVVMKGALSFDKHWFKTRKYDKHDDPFYLNDEDIKLPPKHSRADVMREANIKQGTFKVRGDGCLLVYSRVKGSWGSRVALYETATGQRFQPHWNDDTAQVMYGRWVFKDGRWDGAWTGKWTGMGKDVDPKRLGGRVPPGQIKTFDVVIEQYWLGWEFIAPTEVEYELWFFPREGGGVKMEK